MAEQETILTEEGLKKLEDELDYLRSEKRQQVAERLKVAISYGDISENSEYMTPRTNRPLLKAVFSPWKR